LTLVGQICDYPCSSLVSFILLVANSVRLVAAQEANATGEHTPLAVAEAAKMRRVDVVVDHGRIVVRCNVVEPRAQRPLVTPHLEATLEMQIKAEVAREPVPIRRTSQPLVLVHDAVRKSAVPFHEIGDRVFLQIGGRQVTPGNQPVGYVPVEGPPLLAG